MLAVFGLPTTMNGAQKSSVNTNNNNLKATSVALALALLVIRLVVF
jgi:hypothetical protein